MTCKKAYFTEFSQSHVRPEKIGILGGMGPLATAHFYTRLIQLTPAERDQDHASVVLLSDSKIPDRTANIIGKGESPLSRLTEGVQHLEKAGCRVIAIPCNTAHYWIEEIRASTSIPILSIIDAVISELCRSVPDRGAVGLLATEGTIRSRVYRNSFASNSIPYDLYEPPTDAVDQAIRLIKANQSRQALDLIGGPVRDLVAEGVTTIILGCSELPVIAGALHNTFPEVNFIDCSDALAHRLIYWSTSKVSAA